MSNDVGEEYEERLRRLERRAKRERSAREQAERIAEDGMRRLFLANEELDARVAERTEQLENERREAARSAGERAEFLRLLSRETRSPLNGVIGVMEVIDQNSESEQVRAWLADGLASANTLDSIMTRLLLFLELEGENPGEMTVCDPADVISEVSARWKHEALRAGLLMSTDNRCQEEVHVAAHLSDVQLIFDELVSNAIKHGEAGLMRIVADCAGDSIEFSVEDPGPGIADTAPLLDPSFLDTQNTGARGMGYSLIKRLLARTGAEMEIESSSGGPTIVRLRLPSDLPSAS